MKGGDAIEKDHGISEKDNERKSCCESGPDVCPCPDNEGSGLCGA